MKIETSFMYRYFGRLPKTGNRFESIHKGKMLKIEHLAHLDYLFKDILNEEDMFTLPLCQDSCPVFIS
jgi:hypothetical protein